MPVLKDVLQSTLSDVLKPVLDTEVGPPATFTEATGGTVTTDGDFKIHTFNSNANFTVTQVGTDNTVEYLVEAGGGGGANGAGAGGGAGGYQAASGHVITAQVYPAVIGAGGAAQTTTNTDGNPGNNSTFDTITGNAGGFGGTLTANGGNGGSGGGGGGGSGVSTTTGGSATQGSAGGDGGDGTGEDGGAGGGGSSAVGSNTATNAGGNGGAGTSNSITGSAVEYAGGGGGGTWTGTVGGSATGGGGAGAATNGAAGADATANTGGGGGGGGAGGGNGGAGGSGVVIIRYKFQQSLEACLDMVNVNRPSGIDDTVFNPNEIVYVKGNESTDGSIRLVVDELLENVEFQFRSAGVWNVTGIQIAAASVFLGWSLKLSGVGEWLQTFEDVTGNNALIPHVFYTDAGTGTVHSPVLNAKLIKIIFQPDDSEEVTGTTLSIDVMGATNALLSKAYLRVGSIGATSPVMVTLRAGSSTGVIFWQENFPASVFGTPNSEVDIELESLVETIIGDNIYVEMKSDNPISLKSNLAGVWWIATDFWPVAPIDLSTVNGYGTAFVESLGGTTIPVSAVNVWTDIDDGGIDLIWQLAANPLNFTLTNSNNGEITYGGLIPAPLRLGGSSLIGGAAGFDGMQIGVSVNGNAPTPHTITRGLVTPVQLESITCYPAAIMVSPGDTVKLQFRNIDDGSSATIFEAKNGVF